MIFSRGALGCLALKVRHGWHFPTCSFAWTAMQGQKNWSHMSSSMCSRPRWPTLSWHLFRATSLCAAGKTSWKRVSSDSLCLTHLYRITCLSRRWFHSHRNWLNSGRSIHLDCHCPRVPSCNLEMTKLRVGSACWAWCQSFKVIQVICWLSWIASKMCRSQLYASMGLVGPLRVTSCTACTAAAVTLRWVPELSGTHPGQDTLNKVCASMLVLLA